ncbi:MAG: hypothetical protein QM656_17890, partial [Paracoccaceae bacterium]
LVRLGRRIADKDRIDRVALRASAALSLLGGMAVFSAIPLTSWWALLAPFLWGFFADLSLSASLQRLQALQPELPAQTPVKLTG